MLSIQTNIAALSAQNSLTSTNNSLQTSMERLSSGFRINRAADDAAGLAISEKMQAQIGGLNQAVRNANDGASMIQTAEGALDQVQTMLVRMRNLAVQASSDTNGPTERADINVEIQQLQSEIDNIANRTTFNGLGLLNGAMVTAQNAATSDVKSGLAVGTAGAVTSVDVSGAAAGTTYTFTYDAVGKTLTLSDGTNSSIMDVSSGSMVAPGASATLDFAKLGVKVSIANADTSDITGDNIGTAFDGLTIVTAAGNHSATLQTGADANAYNTTTVSLVDTRLATAVTGVTDHTMTDLATSIATFNTAADLQNNPGGPTDVEGTDLINKIDAANGYISTQRAQLGAAQNRLGYAAASLTTTAQNVTAANSQIRDVDVASETSNMSKDQILMQAGVSVLAQANQVQQLALKLLG
jgi:flagellin